MLTEKQLKGAWMIAYGRTDAEAYRAAGCAERTFYRWRKKPEFEAAVKFLTEQRESEIAAKADEAVSLSSARADEEKALSYQRQLVSELGQASVDLIKQIRANGIEELGPRYIGPLIKGFVDAVNVLQNSNDRLIGLESLINDVEEIEEALQSRAEPISEGG